MKKEGKGFAITSFIFGLMMVLTTIIEIGSSQNRAPVSQVLPSLIIYLALSATFGLISFTRHKRKLALTGLILAGIAVLLTPVAFLGNTNTPVVNLPVEETSMNGVAGIKKPSPAVIYVVGKRIPPYSNGGKPFWKFEVTFEETGGKSGFIVTSCRETTQNKARNYYRYNSNGNKTWDSYSMNLTVKAGESRTWEGGSLIGDSFIGGKRTFDFTIVDDLGNTSKRKIEIGLYN